MSQPTSPAANPAEPFIRRREQNLAFFKTRYPQLYQHLKDYKLQRFKLNILPATDEVDLWLEGHSLYSEGARAYAKNEVEQFRRVFGPGSVVRTIDPPAPGLYCHPRFAHSAVDEAVRQSSLDRVRFRGYVLGDFYPMVTFLGCGLGYHIEAMILQHQVDNALVVEPDLDQFAATLYAVDWEKICEKFLPSKGRTLHFLIGTEKTAETIWAATWNELITRCPVFPALTLFYNHRGDPVYNEAAEKINTDTEMFLNSWGHYDDEMRQVNNALHTFYMGCRVLPDRPVVNPDVPYLVVGSGPSLDDRLDSIRAVRDKLVLVSAGTGLGVLLRNGLKPDFHVELESDAVVFKVLSEFDPELLKSIPLIAPSHICPRVWTLFADQRFYFKKESPTSEVFGRPAETIADGTPTCTNAAFAIGLHLGFRKIYLFGTDYGFRSQARHHAQKSIYTLEGGTYETKWDSLPPGTFEIDDVQGSKIYTSPVYFTSKRKTELLARDARTAYPGVSIINCSDGALIEYATWQSAADFVADCRELDAGAHQASMQAIFAPDARQLDVNELKHKRQAMIASLKAVSAEVDAVFDNLRLKGRRDALNLIMRCNTYVEQVLKKAQPGFYYMVRGTLWHFLFVGYSHALALTDDAECMQFVRRWQKIFQRTLRQLPDHFAAVTGKVFDLYADPWVLQTINDEEFTPDEWFREAGVPVIEGLSKRV